MIHTDARFASAVEAAVSRLEAGTDAEVVVVAAARSASYRDASLLLGGAGGLAMLVAVLFVDRAVAPWMVPVDVALGAALGYGLGRLSWVLRRLVPASRRRRAVLRAARDAFVEEAVHATPQRSGVLVYVSALEGEVVVLPDVGVEAAVPRGRWVAAARAIDGRDLDRFLTGLAGLGEVLCAHLPPTPEGALRVELSDAPRVRP